MISSLKIGISPMPSSRKSAQIILEKIKDSKESTVVDLGSGFGSLAIFLATNLPEKRIIGYELSFFPWIISKLLKYVLNIKNVDFYKKDFLKQDLKSKVLVSYLFPEGMQKLEDKIFHETINTKIISSTFAFRNIKQRETTYAQDLFKTPIFIYKT